MAVYYHGTTILFDHFDMSHLFEGDGKCKFGIGEYATSVYGTAALYSGKGKGNSHYVYTITVPDLTDDNHIISAKPVNQSIISRAEEQLGVLPDEIKCSGKFFRKYIGNLLIGNKGTVTKMKSSLNVDGEIAVSKFLYSIGVMFLIWPNAQSQPDNGEINIAILNDKIIKITKIESVELDDKGRFVIGSNKVVRNTACKKSSTGIFEFIRQYYPAYLGDQRYPKDQTVFFHKKTDAHWILSNMASTPIVVGGVSFKSSEHLFQTMKFSTEESIRAVYHSNSPKMTAKHYQKLGGHRRADWGMIIIDAMKFCLQQKYDQCPEFRQELEETKGLNIVELQDRKTDNDSSRANGWGVKTKGEIYVGPNIMGRLLMELRDNGYLDWHLPKDASNFSKIK